MTGAVGIFTVETVQPRTLFIRGRKVIVDSDLARFYGVSTKRLNEQVRRNRERFPEDFVFQLVAEEKSEVVATCDHLRNLRFSTGLPYAFTEHGALMAATVLSSARAVEMSVFVVRAFVGLRRALAGHSVGRLMASARRRLAPPRHARPR